MCVPPQDLAGNLVFAKHRQRSDAFARNAENVAKVEAAWHANTQASSNTSDIKWKHKRDRGEDPCPTLLTLTLTLTPPAPLSRRARRARGARSRQSCALLRILRGAEERPELHMRAAARGMLDVRGAQGWQLQMRGGGERTACAAPTQALARQVAMLVPQRARSRAVLSPAQARPA